MNAFIESTVTIVCGGALNALDAMTRALQFQSKKWPESVIFLNPELLNPKLLKEKDQIVHPKESIKKLIWEH